MIIQAELRRKQSEYEGEACSVDKVIELPAQRFKQFSRALLADYDFIAENKNAIRHDEEARHCLLILDAEGTDGFLVDPQGHNYARYPDGVGKYADFIRANWLGKHTADCVGLIKGYGWLSTDTMTIDYGTHGMPDVGANEMYYSATQRGSIETMPDTPGLAVWKSGHIGVYIGNGEVIEAMGTKYGVVKTQLEGRGWTHWLEIPYINYA